jgi:cell division protein FtsL
MAQVAYAPQATRPLPGLPARPTARRTTDLGRSSQPTTLGAARSRTALCLTVCVLLTGLVAATYLAHSGSVATSSYSLQRLRAERDSWRARNEQLRLELAKARSLTWVEHEAVTRLDMKRPGQLTYLKVESNVPQPAGPDQRR